MYKRLKLKYGKLLSKIGFNLKLRRYIWDTAEEPRSTPPPIDASGSASAAVSASTSASVSASTSNRTSASAAAGTAAAACEGRIIPTDVTEEVEVGLG
jgi:hypothetical protein